MSGMKLLKSNFTIKELKYIEDFNLLCHDFMNCKSFRAKTIFMYEKTNFNFDKLKRFLLIIKDIYNKRLKEGYDENEIKEFIPDENTCFIESFIDEHEKFSKRMNGILNISTSYHKCTIKEKADKYIRKICPFLHQNGLVKTLEEIVYKDKLSLHVLNNEYFDNLVYYTLVCDSPRLKNSTFYYQDYFDTANITMGYDNLIKRVFKYSKFKTPIEINNETCTLANEARYINNIKPDDFLDKLKRANLDNNEINEVYSEYKKYFDERKKQDEEEKKSQEQKELDENISKNVEVVKGYINSKIIILDNYLTTAKMHYTRFMKSVNILKENNHPVYAEYLKKLEKEATLIDFEILLFHLKNGIVVNGKKVRDFDIVDYYRITSLLPSETKRIAYKKIPYDDYLIVSNFYKKYLHDVYKKDEGKDELLRMLYSYPIGDGNEYIATEEEKNKALLSLEKMGIPLTQYTYKTMIKRITMPNVKKAKEYQKTIGTK